MTERLQKNLKSLAKSVNKTVTEKLLIYPFILGMCIYVGLYGKYITHGFQDASLNKFILIIFIPIVLIDSIKTILECTKSTNFLASEENTKNVTVIIPTKDGGGTIGATIGDLLEKFKPRQIIVASNGSTDNTADIARENKVRLLEIKKPIGKIDAINAALSMVKTEYCMTMDDDVLIGGAVIPTNLLEHSTGVAFRVLPKIDTWITQIQAHEYRKSMDIGKNFQNSSATVQNISGAIGLFKTKELIRQIDLHTGEFSGEDLQRTLLIHLAEEQNGVILSESIVETEVPNTLWALFMQRIFGWGPGLLSNTLNFFKLITKKNVHPKLRYESFHTVFFVLVMDPLRLIAFPIIIFFPTIALIVYITYVLLEAVPYFKLGSKEPIWVLFAMPLYGIFSFIARIIGSLVFIHRRVAVLIARKPKWDDYRIVTLGQRLASMSIASVIFISLIGLVIYGTKPVMRTKLIHAISDAGLVSVR